jgi:DNA mismatch endonuclease, patch repair protein
VIAMIETESRTRYTHSGKGIDVSASTAVATMADTFTKAKRRQIMQSVRRKKTKPEETLATLLREKGLSFQQNVEELQGEPDFYFPDANLVVFVHGCFWHGHDGCRKGRSRPKSRRRYWAGKIARNQRRDRRVARELRARGLSVFTVWECQLRKGTVPARLRSRLAFGDCDTDDN